jgi:hypothetical protein
MSDEIRHYCNAYSFYELQKYEEALSEIAIALKSKPKEAEFRELSLDLRYKLKDLTAIDDEISYHLDIYSGLSSMIHSGKATRWVNLLKAQKQPEALQSFVDMVNKYMDIEIANKSAKRPDPNPIVRYLINGSAEAGKEAVIQSLKNEVIFAQSCKDKFNALISKNNSRKKV